MLRSRYFISIILLWAAVLLPCSGSVRAGERDAYLGSAGCRECHEDQYNSYKQFAKKAHSYHSVEVMADKLAPDELAKCYSCHTTGYGKPGGFVSPETTPDLKDAGCESCHGPGAKHAESADPADIKGTVTVEDCAACHSQERVAAFRFRPLIYGGGH